ncbi:MAG: alpha/beta fold hydrolase [Cyanobacteria bacterium SZAS LIN-2]|nr:alpha/beta fold hydrolase [Cyanobacteria bacterium SZAS LIN-3]MBS1995334.1 alpha/beta fold hydrolase [Cyanobacteria bacterium SZAS LIN-2]
MPALNAILLAASLLLTQSNNTAASAATKNAKTGTQEDTVPVNAAVKSLHEAAIDAYHKYNYDLALKTYRELLKRSDLEAQERIRVTTAAGASAFHLSHYREALKYYDTAEKLLEKLPAGQMPRVRAEIVCSRAESTYEIGDHTKSAEQFLTAIELWKNKEATDDILMRSLEGLGASYFQDGKYKEALPVYQELAWRDGSTLGVESLQYGWSLRILSDVYRALGEKKETQACNDRSAWIFRNWNKNKELAQYSHLIGRELTRAQLESKLSELIVGKLDNGQDLSFIKPAALTHITDRGGSVPYDPVARRKTMVPWERHRIVMRDPAGIQWTNPLVKPQGIIVCVPGFGLQHGSFDDFGRRMADLGYLVISYDVRGFGAYTALKALHSIDLERTIDDLAVSADVLRREFPGLPVFILGESMGGSVALQFVAYHPELVNGLIAAVPSAQRTGGWLAAAKIELGMLTSKDRVANVESYIVNRATTNPYLREYWEHDPESRFTMTPAELNAYTSFLKRNDKCAAMITKTPVIMFQGLNDLLIRPEGSVKLIREITTHDKDLVLIGKSQHLLFEQGQFNDDIISQVTNWMKMHSRPHQAETAK